MPIHIASQPASHGILYLRTSVDLLQRRPSLSIPESNRSIGRTSSRSKNAVLVWGPGDGLDGSCVLRKVIYGSVAAGMHRAPNTQLIVVSSRCQVTAVE